MISADVGVAAPLELMLYDGAPNKGAKAFVRDQAGALLSTITLSHVGDGLYLGEYTPLVLGYFHVNYIVYTTPACLQEDIFYDRAHEVYQVTNTKSQIQTLITKVDANATAIAAVNALVASTSNQILAGVSHIDGHLHSIAAGITTIEGGIDQIKESLDIIFSYLTNPDEKSPGARLVIPEQLLKPIADEKRYYCFFQFTNSFDVPEDPDATPLITVRRLDTNAVISSGTEMVKVTGHDGLYSYSFLLTPESDEFPMSIEVAATDRSVTRYYQAVSEVMKPVVNQYRLQMSTVYNNVSGHHEIIVWAEKDGFRLLGPDRCKIVVKNSAGVEIWQTESTSPNTDGVFFFGEFAQFVVDQNYYVMIELDVDGNHLRAHRPFFTMG